MNGINNNIHCYTVNIHAILFGIDERILNVKFINDYHVKRLSLVPAKSHLDKIFNINAIELRGNYQAAIIDSNLNVACMHKTFQFESLSDDSNDLNEKIQGIISNELTVLDDQIREIRLLSECPIRFKEFAFRVNAKGFDYHGKTPIHEAYSSSNNLSPRWDNDIIDFINASLGINAFPLEDECLNNCHILYDFSYHQLTYPNALLLLIICLEMLFLNSKDTKKEVLSKRCATFISDNQQDRLSSFDELKKLYKKRSDFVHEGNGSKIEENDVLFLRKCVRESLLKYLKCGRIKQDVISDLKKEIESFGYFDI